MLAEQLCGRLLPVPHVQLDEVAAALDDEQGGVLHLATGETTLYAVLEALEEEADLDAPDVLEVPGQRPAAACQDRRLFVDGVADERARDALSTALEGRRAFRRFSVGLDRWPELVAEFLTCVTNSPSAGPAAGSPTPACSAPIRPAADTAAPAPAFGTRSFRGTISRPHLHQRAQRVPERFQARLQRMEDAANACADASLCGCCTA